MSGHMECLPNRKRLDRQCKPASGAYGEQRSKKSESNKIQFNSLITFERTVESLYSQPLQNQVSILTFCDPTVFYVALITFLLIGFRLIDK
jgi:hypothetical protein